MNMVIIILKKAFETYKNTLLVSIIGSFFLFLVIFLLYTLFLPTLIGISYDDFVAMSSKNPTDLAQLLQSTDFKIKIALFWLLIKLIIAPLSAGFYTVFHSEEKSIKKIFYHYNSEFTLRILSFVFFTAALTWVCDILFLQLGWDAVAFSISTMLIVLFTLTIPIQLFENQPLAKSMRKSVKMVSPQVFSVVFLLGIGFLSLIAGAFLFGFGLCLTIPFFYAINYQIYQFLKQ